MFQLNLTGILAAQIGQPTYLPMLIRPKQETQDALQAQINQGNTLAAQEPSVEVAQAVGQWLNSNGQLITTFFEADDFMAHYLQRPVWGPVNLGVEAVIPDHRNLVTQTGERLKALFVLTVFLPERDIVTAPQSHIHPSLRAPVWTDYTNGHFEQAVAAAWVEVERATRTKALVHEPNLAPLTGRNFMTSAFRPQQNANPGAAAPPPPGPLTDVALVYGEQAGIMETFAGVMGAFRNPPNHRHVPYTRRDAYAEILFASRLLFYIDTRP